MSRVRLVHWNVKEAEERVAILRAAGYTVDYEPLAPQVLREMRNDPPEAVVIDLTRLPTQGRDIALAIRHNKKTRYVPLVFIDGDPEKVARIKGQLPDAVYTTWSQIHNTLKQTIVNPPTVTVVPRSILEGYAGAPLVKKLGIKANSVVALVDAPPGFENTIGEMPEGITLLKQASSRTNLTIWFVRSHKDLKNRIAQMVSLIKKGGSLWILWPKKISQKATDLSQTAVRQAGLAAGLVDYKVCAVDAVWSGLLFTRRKST